MLAVIGLERLSTGGLYWVAALLAVGGWGLGWITDLVLQKAGYGVIGNGLVAVVGAVAGLAAYNNFVHPLRTSPALTLVILAFFAGMAAVMLAAIVKRSLR